MQRIPLLLLFLACVGYGRRVQTSITLKADDELSVAELEKKLSSNKFKKIRDLEKKIDQEMKAMESDPATAKFKEEADQIIDKKLKEIMADPAFKEIQEYQEKADKQSAVFMEQAQKIDKSQPVEEQLTELRKIQDEIAKVSAEASKEMTSLPNFDLFKEQSEELINENIAALKADRRFKKVLEKSKSIDEKMQKLVSEPNFEEYQKLAVLLYEKVVAEKSKAPAQSLAQVSQSTEQSDAKSHLVTSLSQLLLPTYNPMAAAFDSSALEAHLQWGRSRRASSQGEDLQIMKHDWIRRKQAAL